jgi:hypothetical protein
MTSNSQRSRNPVAERLRPLVYLYAAANLAVAALLFATVQTTLPPQGGPQQVAALR